jgi:hypothetical protein
MSDTGSGILAGLSGEPYNLLISLGLELGKTLLGHLTKAKAPQEVLDAVGAAVTAIEAHSADLMTAKDWDAAKAHVPAEGDAPPAPIVDAPAPAPGTGTQGGTTS